MGDPTETALLQSAQTLGLDREQALHQHPRRDAIPFASEQQFMATLHGTGSATRSCWRASARRWGCSWPSASWPG
ncbi:MAG: hypothetical protein ACKOZN_12525 [Cyanobium sp.]